MNEITALQRMWELEEELRDDEKELLQAEHALVDAHADVVKAKRDRDESLEKLQVYKKKYDL
jgi:hypothetical protein